MATIRQDNDTKVFLVTGATGAIGKAIAQRLADIEGSEVVLVCRDKLKAEKAVNEIIGITNNPRVRSELADLGRHQDIRDLANRWSGPLHALVNNAACTPRDRQETPEGIEMQFATNVLGYFWMTDEFTEILKASAPARVVNVASYWAGGLDLNDLEFKRRNYDNDKAYRQSKQADRMLSAAFAEKLKPFQGAGTPVWLATRPIGKETTGRYFGHLAETNCPFSQDKLAVNALYDACSNV